MSKEITIDPPTRPNDDTPAVASSTRFTLPDGLVNPHFPTTNASAPPASLGKFAPIQSSAEHPNLEV